MSLKARYYNKREEDKPSTEGNLERGTMLWARRDTGMEDETKEEKLLYRVLAVYNKYNNKWFPMKPDDLPIKWEIGKGTSEIRLKVQLLKKIVDDLRVWYVPIKVDTKYTLDDIYRMIGTDKVLEIIGEIGTE